MANVFGRVVLELAASVGTLQSDLAKGVAEVKTFKDNVSSVGASIGKVFAGLAVGAAVTGFIHSLKEIVDKADEFSKLSQKVGVTVEKLQELDYAAKLSDVSTDSLGGGLKKLAKIASEAAGGNEAAVESFAKLGISVKDANGQVKTTDALFVELADKFSGYKDGVNKTAQAMVFFGKTGADLIPLLNSGASGLKDMADEAHKLGNVMSAETAKSAEAFNDNLTRLQISSEKAKIAIVGSLLPSLVDLSDQLVLTAKNSDGLISSLRTYLDFNPFNSTAENIDQTRQRISKLKQDLEDVKSGKLNTAYANPLEHYNQELKEANDGLSVLLLRQKQAADKNSASYSNEGRSSIKQVKPKELPNAPATGSPAKDTGADSAADKIAKAQIDQRIKILEKYIDAEKSTYEERKNFLDRYYQDASISLNDYYRGLEVSRNENLNAEVDAYNKEIAALEDYKQKAKPAERVHAETKIQEAIAKRTEAEKKASSDGVKAFLDEQKAIKDFNKQLLELDAHLASLQGNTALEVSVKFDIQNEELMKKLLLNGDFPAVEKLKKIKLFEVGNAEIADLQSKIDLITSAQENAEKRINIAVKKGAIGELEGMHETSKVRKDAVYELDAIAAKWQEIADRTGDPKIAQGLDSFRTQVAGVYAESNLLADKFTGLFQDSFSTFFTDVITGTKTVGDAFRDMASNIVAQISRIAAQQLATSLFGGAGGGGGENTFGAAGSGIGGFVSAAFNLFTSGFAKGGAFDGGVQKFASGGAFTNGIVNSPTMFNLGQMGEAGPEAIMPLKRGRDGKLGIHGGQSSQNITNLYMTVNATDANSFARSQGQLMSNATRALQQGRRNQ